MGAPQHGQMGVWGWGWWWLHCCWDQGFRGLRGIALLSEWRWSEPATTAMVASAGEARVHVGSSPTDPIRLFGIEDCIRDEAARRNL